MAQVETEVETKSLPANAYEPLKEGELYVPLVPTSASVPEITGRAVLWGTLLCIIPGLVVASMYKFTYLFILDKKMEFWPAMQASHDVVKNDYFGFTMFLILAFLVNVLGLLCCVVGLLVTVPLTIAAITVAYKEIVGFEQRTIDAL